MKLFVSKLNVATISAITVGIIQFSVRSYQENNGTEKIRKVTLTVLAFIDKIVKQLQQELNTDVPVVKVAHKKSTKT